MNPVEELRLKQEERNREAQFNSRWLPLFLKVLSLWTAIVALPVFFLGVTTYVIGATVYFFGIAVLAAATAVRVRRQVNKTI